MGRHRRVGRVRGTSVARLTLCAGAVGVGALQLAAPALAAPTAAPTAARSATPCAITAKACVDVSRGKAWLTDGKGHVTYGAVPVTTGADGLETPTGTFGVTRKDKDHRSGEYDGADMHNAVFFHDGSAFHEGSLERESAGCVHLSPEASERFFDALQVYDEVQIVP